LLNKTDLVTVEELEDLEKRIRDMNAIAKIYRTKNSDMNMDQLLGIRAFDLEKALEIDPQFLSEDAHQHDESVYSVAIVESGELDLDKLHSWMGELLQTQGTDIFRMKGILNVSEMDERVVFQGVHMLFDVTIDRPWKPEEIRKNELVFIGRNLDEKQLKEDFQECLI
jgi:G3E family GTPase